MRAIRSRWAIAFLRHPFDLPFKAPGLPRAGYASADPDMLQSYPKGSMVQQRYWTGFQRLTMCCASSRIARGFTAAWNKGCPCHLIGLRQKPVEMCNARGHVLAPPDRIGLFAGMPMLDPDQRPQDRNSTGTVSISLIRTVPHRRRFGSLSHHARHRPLGTACPSLTEASGQYQRN